MQQGRFCLAFAIAIDESQRFAEDGQGILGTRQIGRRLEANAAIAKVGDNIEATVYDGDFKLYKVHVVKK